MFVVSEVSHSDGIFSPVYFSMCYLAWQFYPTIVLVVFHRFRYRKKDAVQHGCIGSY